jgi:hypothetical protein
VLFQRFQTDHVAAVRQVDKASDCPHLLERTEACLVPSEVDVPSHEVSVQVDRHRAPFTGCVEPRTDCPDGRPLYRAVMAHRTSAFSVPECSNDVSRRAAPDRRIAGADALHEHGAIDRAVYRAIASGRGGRHLRGRDPPDEDRGRARLPGPRHGRCAGTATGTDARDHLVPVGPLVLGFAFAAAEGGVMM